MMINCPKCNFLQEKDTYCAQCGVNMETYRPPQVPIVRKLLSNWMVQLGLLFSLIFIVVLSDNFSGRDRPSRLGSLPPVAERIQRNEMEVQASVPSPTPEKSNRAETQALAPTVERQKMSFSARESLQEEDRQKPFFKRVSMKIIGLSRQSLDSFLRTGRRVDEGVAVFSRQQLKSFLKDNPGSMRSYGTSRSSFQLGQPAEIFLGEEDVVTGNTIGFFSQINVAEGSTGESINLEARFWYQLASNSDASSPLIYETTLSHQETLVIVDPSIHDLEFSNEDRSLFDSSENLRGLNSETFLESDVALFLEVK